MNTALMKRSAARHPTKSVFRVWAPTSNLASNRGSGGHADRLVRSRKSVSMVTPAIQSSLKSTATKAVGICQSFALAERRERGDVRTVCAIGFREPRFSRLFSPDCQRSKHLSRCLHCSGRLIKPRISCTTIHGESRWTITPGFRVQLFTVEVGGPLHPQRPCNTLEQINVALEAHVAPPLALAITLRAHASQAA